MAKVPANRHTRARRIASADGGCTVLWLIKGLDYGGAEQLLVSYASHVKAVGFRYVAAHVLRDVAALAPALEACGVPVSSLGARSTVDLRWLVRLFRLLGIEHVDIVHVQSPYPAIFARLLVRLLPPVRRPALVTTDHIEVSRLHPVTRALYRWTYGLDDLHLAVSGRVRDSVPRRERPGVEVVYQGIPLAEVEMERGHRAASRAELGAAPEELIIGTVANMREQKGYPELLAAATKVLASCPFPVRFVAIGDGPLLAGMKRFASELNLGAGFQFLGARPNAQRLVAGFDLFVLASRYEGLPLALLEALALGVPVVATDVGGVPEAVRNHREGVLVPPGDPAALADALLALIAKPQRRDEIAVAARRRSRAFDIDDTVSRTQDLYRRIMS